MKIISLNDGELTNLEVYNIVQERRENRIHKHPHVSYADRNWIDHKIIKYLQHDTSGVGVKGTDKQQLTHAIEQCFNDQKQLLKTLDEEHFELNTAEKLQILNLRPAEVVDLYLIIENCEERFDDDQLDKLLNLVKQYLRLNQKQDMQVE